LQADPRAVGHVPGLVAFARIVAEHIVRVPQRPSAPQSIPWNPCNCRVLLVMKPEASIVAVPPGA
jgi:hypothetical protein